MPGPDATAVDHKNRPLKAASYISGRSAYAATDAGIWIIEGDVIRFRDRETGAVTREIAGPTPGRQLRWLSHDNGLLAVLQGEPDAMVRNIYDVWDKAKIGNHIAVYDEANGRLVWQETLAAPVDERMIGCRDGRLYYLEHGRALVCRALSNSNTVYWQQDDATVIGAIDTEKSAKKLRGLFQYARAFIITERVLVVGGACSRCR